MGKYSRILLLTFWVMTGLCAQPPFAFNHIGIDDGLGLASNVVYCTYQDPQGFIWVGTANGLQRFDGNRFMQIFSGKEQKTQMISALTQIVPADAHTLWLSFPNRQEFGLFRTDTYTYTPVPISANKPLNRSSRFRMWKDANGEIFVTILGYGILHYNKHKQVFTDDNYFGFPAGWIPTIGHYEDTLTKRIWFPCNDKGMAVFDVKTKALFTPEKNPQHIPLLNRQINFSGAAECYIDKKRRYWIFCWQPDYLKRCFSETGQSLKDTIGLNFNPHYSEAGKFMETSDGELWIYGLNSLYQYDKRNRRFNYYANGSRPENSFHFQYAFHMMEDRDECVWLSTDNGLYVSPPVSGETVVNRLFEENNGTVETTDILELRSGQRWISTWGNQVLTFTKNMQPYDAGIYHDLPKMDDTRWIQLRQVWSLYQHRDGKVWIGCQAGNLMIYDTATRKTKLLLDPVFRGSTIRYITGDNAGNILFGTFHGDIIRFNGQQFETLQSLGSIVHKIMVDREGKIWACADNNGLFCLSPDGRTVIWHFSAGKNDGHSLFANTGHDIEQLNDTTIVFGADAMNFINTRTGRVYWLTVEQGLPGNTIQRMRMDADGYLWMITLNGLCRYNPATGRITSYNRKDGIVLSNLTTEADYFTSDGVMMFTGLNALLYFKPSVFRNSSPPDVTITDCKLFNDYLPVDSILKLPEINLGHTQNSLSIYFAALSYLKREKLTYYYKMSGIDNEWLKADRQNYVNYSLLPPGHYTFMVYCENIDGVKSAKTTQVHFYIRPPFWQTWWFIGLILISLSAIAYFIHRLRINRLLAVEKVRNRVARDLHDDMGSTLSTINILSAMARTRMQSDPVKTQEYLGKISDNSQRMMEAMDDIVWSIKPSNDSMHKMTARMREFAGNLLETKEIEIEFAVGDGIDELKLDMEARRDLFLIFKEAVNNAAKYAAAGWVSIRFEKLPGFLSLIVEDNGIGFAVDTADNGNGLGNMRKRADALRGTLSIQSAAGQGTRVSLLVPISS